MSHICLLYHNIYPSELDFDFYQVNFSLQVDSEEEKIPEEKFVEELAKNVPQGTDKTPELLDSALKDLPDRYDTIHKHMSMCMCPMNCKNTYMCVFKKE